jgi:alanine dehydrogenase
VIAGTAPGRTSETDVTVFDSGGTGLETVAATHMIYERAVAADYGVELSMTPGGAASPEL